MSEPYSRATAWPKMNPDEYDLCRAVFCTGNRAKCTAPLGGEIGEVGEHDSRTVASPCDIAAAKGSADMDDKHGAEADAVSAALLFADSDGDGLSGPAAEAPPAKWAEVCGEARGAAAADFMSFLSLISFMSLLEELLCRLIGRGSKLLIQSPDSTSKQSMSFTLARRRSCPPIT